MNHALNQQLRRLSKKEQRLLNQKENPILKSTLSPVMDKIQEKIPDKLKSTLDILFYKGFQLVFDKGSTYIEKTYNKNKIQLEYDINNYSVDRTFNNKYINKLDQPSNRSRILNSSISIIEGSALGFLGIGLPDIPLFLSVIVKSIFEIALSYGYTYDSVEEKSYILHLISAAVSKGDKRKELDKSLDYLGDQIDQNIVSEIDLYKEMKTASDVLSDALLTAKFIQGIPVIGVVGGIVNYNIINKINKYARIKYKKRYLQKKLHKTQCT